MSTSATNIRRLPHEAGNIGLPCKDGSFLAFDRTGNGCWQATAGDLFFTLRVSASARTSPPHLHFFDELSADDIDEAARYLGREIDWAAIRPTKFVVVQGDDDGIARVISNGVIGDGHKMAFERLRDAERALSDFQAMCDANAGRHLDLNLRILPSPEADDFSPYVRMARVINRNGICYAVVAN